MGRARFAAFAIAFLVAANAARAQEPSCALSGTVVARSMETGAFIEGADVSVPRLNRSTTTDATGAFRLGEMACGKHEVQVRKIGFAVWRDTVDLTAGQELKRVYTLVAVAQLDTVRVTSDEIVYQTPRLQDFEVRRRKNVGGNFISEARLRQKDNAGATFASILRDIPGLNVVFFDGKAYVRSRGIGSAGGDQPLGSGPGSPKGCWAPVYLDGLLLFDGIISHDIKPPDMGQFFAANLSGVEFYPSAGSTPFQFRTTKSNCGVLLLWTRGR